MNVWQSVKVKNTDHPRAGEAGIVFAIPADPLQVVVRFDVDLALWSVDLADLVAL